jgi:hypothetical protein
MLLEARFVSSGNDMASLVVRCAVKGEALLPPSKDVAVCADVALVDRKYQNGHPI